MVSNSLLVTMSDKLQSHNSSLNGNKNIMSDPVAIALSNITEANSGELADYVRALASTQPNVTVERICETLTNDNMVTETGDALNQAVSLAMRHILNPSFLESVADEDCRKNFPSNNMTGRNGVNIGSDDIGSEEMPGKIRPRGQSSDGYDEINRDSSGNNRRRSRSWGVDDQRRNGVSEAVAERPPYHHRQQHRVNGRQQQVIGNIRGGVGVGVGRWNNTTERNSSAYEAGGKRGTLRGQGGNQRNLSSASPPTHRPYQCSQSPSKRQQLHQPMTNGVSFPYSLPQVERMLGSPPSNMPRYQHDRNVRELLLELNTSVASAGKEGLVDPNFVVQKWIKKKQQQDAGSAACKRKNNEQQQVMQLYHIDPSRPPPYNASFTQGILSGERQQQLQNTTNVPFFPQPPPMGNNNNLPPPQLNNIPPPPPPPPPYKRFKPEDQQHETLMHHYHNQSHASHLPKTQQQQCDNSNINPSLIKTLFISNIPPYITMVQLSQYFSHFSCEAVVVSMKLEPAAAAATPPSPSETTAGGVAYVQCGSHEQAHTVLRSASTEYPVCGKRSIRIAMYSRNLENVSDTDVDSAVTSSPVLSSTFYRSAETQARVKEEAALRASRIASRIKLQTQTDLLIRQETVLQKQLTMHKKILTLIPKNDAEKKQKKMKEILATQKKLMICQKEKLELAVKESEEEAAAIEAEKSTVAEVNKSSTQTKTASSNKISNNVFSHNRSFPSVNEIETKTENERIMTSDDIPGHKPTTLIIGASQSTLGEICHDNNKNTIQQRGFSLDMRTKTIAVQNKPEGTSEEDLKRHFSTFGAVLSVTSSISINRDTNNNKNNNSTGDSSVVIVTFKDRPTADKAKLHGTFFNDTNLVLAWHKNSINSHTSTETHSEIYESCDNIEDATDDVSVGDADVETLYSSVEAHDGEMSDPQQKKNNEIKKPFVYDQEVDYEEDEDNDEYDGDTW